MTLRLLLQSMQSPHRTHTMTRKTDNGLICIQDLLMFTHVQKLRMRKLEGNIKQFIDYIRHGGE
jgi:hypothetical protein